ncbi:MAG TPA: hypothetical protein VJ883_06285 [Woeseiaceae bacterium]|nr:hypothetical protein [Woeseiaceae bacterium]
MHDGHAFIVADAAETHGMRVFDLTRLRGVTAPQAYIADNVYVDIDSAHNLAIDEASGFAYVVGADGPGGCDHGLHMVDVGTPVNPLFAGCHSAVDTHDTHCLVYRARIPITPATSAASCSATRRMSRASTYRRGPMYST